MFSVLLHNSRFFRTVYYNPSNHILIPWKIIATYVYYFSLSTYDTGNVKHTQPFRSSKKFSIIHLLLTSRYSERGLVRGCPLSIGGTAPVRSTVSTGGASHNQCHVARWSGQCVFGGGLSDHGLGARRRYKGPGGRSHRRICGDRARNCGVLSSNHSVNRAGNVYHRQTWNSFWN